MSGLWFIHRIVTLCPEQEWSLSRPDKKQIIHIAGMQFNWSCSPEDTGHASSSSGWLPIQFTLLPTYFLLLGFERSIPVPPYSLQDQTLTYFHHFYFEATCIMSIWNITHSKRIQEKKNWNFGRFFHPYQHIIPSQTKLNLAPNVTISSCGWPCRLWGSHSDGYKEFSGYNAV
jgi:hypothetical protein